MSASRNPGPAALRSLMAMHLSDAWLTVSEMSGVTASALRALASLPVPAVERRWAVWGGEPGQKHGRGYEYRLTPEGHALRATPAHP